LWVRVQESCNLYRTFSLAAILAPIGAKITNMIWRPADEKHPAGRNFQATLRPLDGIVMPLGAPPSGTCRKLQILVMTCALWPAASTLLQTRLVQTGAQNRQGIIPVWRDATSDDNQLRRRLRYGNNIECCSHSSNRTELFHIPRDED
jgi:hypothetical protein